MQITIDAELKALIPALSASEYSQLEANILRDGCQEPLSFWRTDGKNVLLDGHNRHKICEKNNKRFQTIEIEIEDRDHARLWIGTRQLGRRNLTDSQRAVIANEIREWRSDIAKKEKAAEAGKIKPLSNHKDNSEDTSSPKISPTKERTRIAVAKEAKIPERMVRAVQEIKAKAPELIEKVRSGEMTVSQAKHQALKTETKQFKAERAAEIHLPSLAQIISQSNTFFIALDTKLGTAIQELKEAKEIPMGLQISGKELVKLLYKISKHAAEYADKLEKSLRR